MDWLRNLFITNQVIVFAVYGQVFFTLGVALAVQSMKHTRLHLGKQMRWLAGFGLSHGLVEWGYVFIPIQATYLPQPAVQVLQWLQLLLMLISFINLLHFGLRTMIRNSPFREPESSWIVVGALVILTVVLAVAPHSDRPVDHLAMAREHLEIWGRYLLAVPGALVGALGILASARDMREMQLPRIGRWLQISAISMAGYALLNLVTPEHHYFLSRLLNYTTVLQAFGVPAQIWRTLVGAGILYGMVRSLAVFEIETDQRLRAAEQRKLLEAERELAVMNQIAITLGRAREPGVAMGAVLGQLVHFLDCTQGQIALREGGDRWQLVAEAGGASPEHWQVPALIQATADSGEVMTEHQADGRYGVGIPIRVGPRLLAVAALWRRLPMEFSPQERQVVEAMGTLLGVSLENSRLWVEVRRKEAARTEWISRIIKAQEEERRRIAHELHDEVIQGLVLLCRRLDLLDAPGLPPHLSQRLSDTRGEVEGLITALRNFTRDLRPPALDDLGVVASLRRLLDDLGNTSSIQWDLKVGGSPRRLARDTELGLFRIAQEAIRNVQRHAEADHITVELEFTEQGAALKVSDDGKGLPAWAAQGDLATSGRLGLLGMQERAALLGGDLNIQSEPGRGTTVSVNVPAQPERFRTLRNA